MKFKLPALLLLSVTLLSACGGSSPSTPPTGNPPPGDTTPGNPPPSAGIDTASFTFKSAGSPTAILAPFAASGEKDVGGRYARQTTSGDSSGSAFAIMRGEPGRATIRQMNFLFSKRSAAFKIGERIPLYTTGQYLLGDKLTFGANALYSEKSETGKITVWDSLSGDLIVTATTATTVTMKLENATMSENILNDKDTNKLILNGTITYTPKPN